MIRFIDCLQIENIVYILLEFASNGSLFPYIHPSKGLPENIAFRFLYQTALGIKAIHDNKIIHRDLKPENLLLDDGMNIKICDFGWSALIDDENERTTICGTLEYMSPEIIQEKTHNSKVDMWCLGVLLYEMIHGKSPFQASSLIELKSTVSEEKVVFRNDISDEAKMLILGLMNFDSDKRMDIETLLEHPFLMKNYANYFKPIEKDDFAELLQNFYDFKSKGQAAKANHMQKQQKFVEIRVQQGQNKKLISIPVPENIEIIEKTVSTINNFVSEDFSKIKRRNSESMALKLVDSVNEESDYKNRVFAIRKCMAKSILRNALLGRYAFHPSGRVILLERKIDWKEEFYKLEKEMGIENDICFIIFFDNVLNLFLIEAIPYENETNVVRKLVRKEFRGKSKEQLFLMTNIQDFSFCHVTGVKAGCKNLMSASLVADLSL